MRRNLLFTAVIFISFIAACTEKTEKEETGADAPVATEEQEQDQTKLAEPIIEDSDQFLITETGVMGFEIGETIDLSSKNIKKSTWETGEGSFPGYALLDDNGEEVGFIFPQYKDETKINMIQLSSSKYKTKEGLGVGSTFADLKKLHPTIETHGSEVEGSTGSTLGGLGFKLDIYFWSHEIDESQIPASTEVVQIYIQGKPAPQATAASIPEPEVDEASLKEIKYYICYNEDTKKKITIWVGFNDKSDPVQVKYKGSPEPMDIVFKNEVNTNVGGAYPVLVTYYDEIYDGKVNGQYVFTKSGNWYYAEYTRGRDGKVFKFTIDHDANPFGTSPCF